MRGEHAPNHSLSLPLAMLWPIPCVTIAGFLAAACPCVYLFVASADTVDLAPLQI